MEISNRIEELAALQNQGHLISSLYLRLWPDARIHRTRIKDLVRQKKEELNQAEFPESEKELAKRDLDKVQDYVESLIDVPFKGLAVFSCTAQSLWEVIPLTVPVRDLLVTEYSTYTRPLISALSEYKKICTVLIDRGHARFFEIFMGDIKERPQIIDEVVRPRDMGEYVLNERQVERHIQDHVRIHLNRVAERMLSQFQEKGFDWLFLGGQPEILAEMEGALRSPLKERLKATFRMDLNSNTKEVLERSLELMQEIKKEEDRKLVSRLGNSLHRDGLGVPGIHETLSSLYEGSVHTLIIEEGFEQEGAYCPDCGFMGLKAGFCPMCHEPTLAVADIVDEAVASAVDRDCVIVHVNPESGIRELGRIGALLRFKPAIENRAERPRPEAAERTL